MDCYGRRMVQWVAAIAATIAAAASVAVLLLQLPRVEWAARKMDVAGGRHRLTNTGKAPARDVMVRVGSASDPNHIDGNGIMRSPIVRPGEHVAFVDMMAYNDPVDYAVNVTWRGLLGRRQWCKRLI
jgi:hypothetical protein